MGCSFIGLHRPQRDEGPVGAPPYGVRSVPRHRLQPWDRSRAYADASRAADEALRLGSLDAATCCIVGTALLEQHRVKRAITCLRRAVELDGAHVGAHRSLAIALLATSKLHDAIAHSRTVAQLAPEDPQSHVDLGHVLRLHRELDEAIECLRTALQIDPNLIEAHLELAAALQQHGDTTGAAKHRQTAERLRSHPSRHRGAAGLTQERCP